MARVGVANKHRYSLAVGHLTSSEPLDRVREFDQQSIHPFAAAALPPERALKAQS
jgi:hypothetical protein